MTPLSNPSNDREERPLELITTRFHGHIHPGARWGAVERADLATRFTPEIVYPVVFETKPQTEPWRLLLSADLAPKRLRGGQTSPLQRRSLKA